MVLWSYLTLYCRMTLGRWVWWSVTTITKNWRAVLCICWEAGTHKCLDGVPPSPFLMPCIKLQFHLFSYHMQLKIFCICCLITVVCSRRECLDCFWKQHGLSLLFLFWQQNLSRYQLAFCCKFGSWILYK